MTMEKKEAIKILKDFHDKSALFSVRTALETLYPELAKGEDERVRNQIINFIEEYGNPIHCEWQKDWIAWLEKQGEQKPAETVELKCEESKTKVFDAPAPFEDKLYAFVAACEFLAIPSKIEFILEHSQEILDAAREQIGKEQSSTWSKEDEKEYKYVLKFVDNILNNCGNKKDYEHCKRCYDWLKSLKTRCTWKPNDEQLEIIDMLLTNETMDDNIARILRELREQLKKLKGE